MLRYLEAFIVYSTGFRQSVDVNKLQKRSSVLLSYVDGMVKGVNRPRRERVLLSNNLIRTLGIKHEAFAGFGRVRGGDEPKNFNPANVRPRPGDPPPPPPSGVDFSKGETQGYRVATAPPMPRDAPELEPEEPEDQDGGKEQVDRKPVATIGLNRFATRERGAKFTEDQRIRFGDRQGAYYGEEIGERVPMVPVPVPVLPDGEYVHPNSGYVRKAFPKFAVQKKPSNSLKPRRVAPTPKLPMFQDTASGIFSSPRIGIPKVTSIPNEPPFSYTGGRKGLPKTVEGFMELAEKLKGSGHSIRVNPTSKLTSIRQNFIRNLML